MSNPLCSQILERKQIFIVFSHFFVQPGGFTKKLLLNLAEDKDIIYLTSFYAEYGYKTLLLKKEKKIQSPVVIASMGVFSKEALAQKSLKKNVFIAGCKMLHLFNQTTWSGGSMPFIA